MEKINQIFSFLKFTASTDGSKVVYGGSGSGGVTASKVHLDNDAFLSWLLPYVPLIAVAVALLKLSFDLYVFKKEAAIKICDNSCESSSGGVDNE